MTVALIDLDGTLADYDGAMARDLEPLWAPDEASPDRDPRSNEPYMRARQRLVRGQPGWWRDLAPLPVGFEILHALRDANYDLHILTKGPYLTPNAWTEKVEWCRKHVSDAKIIITEDKGLVYGRVLVDDWPPYIEDWLKWRPRGFVVMPSWPWNAGCFDDEPRVLRYCGSGIKLGGFRPPCYSGLQRYDALLATLKEKADHD